MKNFTRHSLPVPITPLIGREQEVEVIQQILRRSEIRLVTLAGIGGVGKTRLALQVALDLADDFADVRFVSLASISDPVLVLPAIAQVFGLQENKTQPLSELLKDYLGNGHVLLILDNFEQVLSAAPTIATLLHTCPVLKVLITSRCILCLSGEYQFSVHPLAVPDLTHLPSHDTLIQIPAVALFIQHIQRVKHDFHLDAITAYQVSAICSRLDGLPLAIELAAMRIKLFPLEELLLRLEHRFQLLIGGPQDLPLRQQTLRNTLEWSYNLLDSDEQRLFRCLACFNSGCTFEAIEAVCKSVADDTVAVAFIVESLLNKSLLYQQEQSKGKRRLTMLETVRDYALEKLTESDENNMVQDAHSGYYLVLAERGEIARSGLEQTLWLEILDEEHCNLRAALSWSIQQKKTERALRLGGALSWFWCLHGDLSEGRRWIAEAMALPEAEEHTKARAKVLYGAGKLALFQGDLQAAQQLLIESQALWHQPTDKQEYAYVLTTLGEVLKHQGELIAACALQKQSHQLFLEIQDRGGSALSLIGMAEILVIEGDYTAAASLLRKSLVILREVGDQWGIALALNSLGEVMRYQGIYAQAAANYSESLIIARQLGNKGRIATLLHNLGYVVRAQGDHEQAMALFKESLTLFRHLEYKRGVAACLIGLAGVASTLGQQELAVKLLGAAHAQCDAIASYLTAVDYKEYRRELALVHAELGETAFMLAWVQGSKITWERISGALEALAREQILLPLAPEVSSASLSPTISRADNQTGLTVREMEVLYLLAQGLTYQQIAQKLVVSHRTVDAHLRSIYGKLGVTSRGAATRYAIEHQLA